MSGEVVEYQYDLLHRLATASVLAGTGVSGAVTGRSHPLQLRPETWFTFAEHRSKPRELVISGAAKRPPFRHERRRSGCVPAEPYPPLSQADCKAKRFRL